MNEYIPKFAYVDSQNFESYFRYAYSKYINFRSLFAYLKTTRNIDKVFIFIKNITKKERIAEFKAIGYDVILCECKDERGSYNIDTDLVITAVEEFFVTQKHDILLMSGDGDFLPLLKFYEDYNCFTEIIGPSKKESVNNQGRPTSNKLIHIRNADGEIENRKTISYYDELAQAMPNLYQGSVRL
jgi:uncharacterized LabA/DUF88 family protein